MTDIEGDKAVIRIYNDGECLEEGDLPHIFKRFYKGKGGNFGIGLSIAQDILKRHKGEITVENVVNGVSFGIILPLINH